MPLFTVAIQEKRYGIAYVQAETEEEAKEKAREDWKTDNENITWSEDKELLSLEADGAYPD